MQAQTRTERIKKFLIYASSLTAFVFVTFANQPQTLANDVYTWEVPNRSIHSDSTTDYWTPKRLQNAKALPLPRSRTSYAAATPLDTDSLSLELALSNSAVWVGEDGRKPLVKVQPDTTNLLFVPKVNSGVESQDADAGLVTPQDKGTLNAHFSSSRLVPLSADRSYPYRTVGKLFFTKPGEGNFVCSASVIKHRVIVTAGHCVHRGSGGNAGFFTNFLFVPAFRDGVAPFQSWSAAYVVVPGTWATGGGTVPNAADYAMIELNDRTINGQVRRIGEVTGWLGYQTLRLLPNHAHLLGYPCNLDNCQKMHQVTAGSFRSVSPNNVEYGSDMRGGSSGGPWVQNFGIVASGQTGGLNAGRNRIIGITSYGYISTDPLVQGSSIPDSRFTTILNTVCAHRAGNCS